MTTRKAAIKAIRSYLPEQMLTNEDLSRELGGTWDSAKILEKTGVASRHIAAEGECSSDLGVRAAEKLFAGGVCAKEDVDFILLCTQSPDYFLPATSCTMQERLGLKRDCGALDFNQGCSGYVYGLALAKSLIETGVAQQVLLITAETYSKFIHPRDRSVRTIFGDGAAATLVGAVEAEDEMIGPFVFGTDGRGAGELIVPSGGMRCPASPDTAMAAEAEGGNWRSQQNLYMNGPEIFSFTLRAVPSTVSRLLRKARMSMEEVDYFVFHQANRFMLDRLRAKLDIPADRFCVYLENCGNTVSSTIPIALEESLAREAIKPDDAVMLVGFGVGFSWAAAMVRFI